MAKKLKIEREDAVALILAIGALVDPPAFTKAKKWDCKRLQKKLNALEEAPDEDLGDEELDDLLDEVMSTEEGNIVVVDSDAKEEKQEAVEKTEKKDKKSKKKSKKEKTEKKDKKKDKTEKNKDKSKKKSKKEKTKKNGILSEIKNLIQKKFISKKEILVILKKKYPEKDEKTISNTISWQLWHLKSEGTNIQKKNNKFRIKP